jgi:hypothetical protein
VCAYPVQNYPFAPSASRAFRSSMLVMVSFRSCIIVTIRLSPPYSLPSFLSESFECFSGAESSSVISSYRLCRHDYCVNTGTHEQRMGVFRLAWYAESHRIDEKICNGVHGVSSIYTYDCNDSKCLSTAGDSVAWLRRAMTTRHKGSCRRDKNMSDAEFLELGLV